MTKNMEKTILLDKNIILLLLLTYLPHKAVAEVSKHNEPIGTKCGIQLVRKSTGFRFNDFELQLI